MSQSFSNALSGEAEVNLSVSFPLTSFASGRINAIALPTNADRKFLLLGIFSSGYIALAMLCGWQLRLSSIGFLDTFDLFDSSPTALPENFLQLPLLSFVSVWYAICVLQKGAIA